MLPKGRHFPHWNELVFEAQMGNSKAKDKLAAELMGYLKNLSYRDGSSHDTSVYDAEDLTADALIATLETVKDYDHQAPFEVMALKVYKSAASMLKKKNSAVKIGKLSPRQIRTINNADFEFDTLRESPEFSEFSDRRLRTRIKAAQSVTGGRITGEAKDIVMNNIATEDYSDDVLMKLSSEKTQSEFDLYVLNAKLSQDQIDCLEIMMSGIKNEKTQIKPTVLRKLRKAMNRAANR